MSTYADAQAPYTIEWEDGTRQGHPRTQYSSKAFAFAELDRMYAATEYPGSLRVIILASDGTPVWAQHGTHIELNAGAESPAEAPVYREMDAQSDSPVNAAENGAQSPEGPRIPVTADTPVGTPVYQISTGDKATVTRNDSGILGVRFAGGGTASAPLHFGGYRIDEEA